MGLFDNAKKQAVENAQRKKERGTYSDRAFNEAMKRTPKGKAKEQLGDKYNDHFMG